MKKLIGLCMAMAVLFGMASTASAVATYSYTLSATPSNFSTPTLTVGNTATFTVSGTSTGSASDTFVSAVLNVTFNVPYSNNGDDYHSWFDSMPSNTVSASGTVTSSSGGTQTLTFDFTSAPSNWYASSLLMDISNDCPPMTFDGASMTITYSDPSGVPPTPEPVSILLVGSGLVGLAGYRLRKRPKA